MKRSTFVFLLLIELIIFTAFSAFKNSSFFLGNEYNRNSSDTTIYYDSKAKEIYVDTNTEENSYYVIRTKKKEIHLYGNLDKTISYKSGDTIEEYKPADINAISRSTYRRVRKKIKNKEIDSFVCKNIIPVLSKKSLKLMFQYIKDDGKGDTLIKNNKEYGGILIHEDSVGYTAIGERHNPCIPEKFLLELSGNGNWEFHSHPSGSSKDTSNDKSTCHYIQPPSKTDQEALLITNRMGYVFGMSSQVIYIYDSTGLLAILPFKYFKAKKN